MHKNDPRPTVLPLLLAGLLAAPAAAGGATLERHEGVLGESVRYELDGDPGEPWFLVPSFSSGPIVLPNDGRSLSIGLELLHLGQIGLLDGGGHATVIFALPANASLQGRAVHAQFVTFPGVTTLVDDISNPASFRLAQHETVHDAITLVAQSRVGHTATTLVDGRVLVAGGEEPNGAGGLTTLATLELYDPQTQGFELAAATLPHPRSAHTATRLADGRVLLLGGIDGTGTVRNTGAIYDPATGMVTATAPMSTPRTQHTATLLADGRVLVAGGSSLFDLSDVLASIAQAKRSTEVYNPATNTWAGGPNLDIGGSGQVGVIGQGASRLGNGQVLLSGGVKVNSFFGIPIPSFTNQAWRYDPGTNQIVATASMAAERVYHGQITLADGTALVAGGADGDFVALSFFSLAGCERYDAGSNSWSPAPSLGHSRAYASLVDLGPSIAIACGLSSVDVATGAGTPEQTIEILPADLSAWGDAATMALPRQVARAVAIEGGLRLLVVGEGDDGSANVDRTAEIFVR